MRICVYGAGATGGHFAVKLANAGHDVSVVARGAHLEAIRQQGLRLRVGDDIRHAAVRASDDPRDLGPQDLVIVAVKATALTAIADSLGPLLHDESCVVFPQNGATWWYRESLPAAHPAPPDLPIFALAPRFLRSMRIDQVIGGIIYSANEAEAPGLIRNNSPAHNRLDLGSITAEERQDLPALRRMLVEAGISSPPVRDMRETMWIKLLGNMSGSVIGLVTQSQSSSTRKDAALSEIYRRVVREGHAIAAAHGYPVADKLDPDIMLSRLIDHKASILQDYEQGRPMEIGEIVLAPMAFARKAGIACPTLDTLAAVATRMAVQRGLFDGNQAATLGLWP